MAVKLPANTYVSQRFFGYKFEDTVFSRIDGSIVGYVKDGKFVQTVKELPKENPEKKKEQDKQYEARLEQNQALLAARILEQSAPYWKELAEDIKQTPAKRAEAKTKYESITAQIAEKKKIAGVAAQEGAADKANKAEADAVIKLDKIKADYAKLQEQYDAVLDPNDPKATRIKAQMTDLVKQSRPLYATVYKKPFPGVDVVFGGKSPVTQSSLYGPDAARINATLPKPTGPTGPTKATSPTGPTKSTGPTGGGATGGGVTGGVTGDGKTGGAEVPSTFNVGSFRAADEASMNKATSTTDTPAQTPTDLQTLLKKTEFWYDLPDYIFNTVPGLGDILVKAVNEGWSNEKFLAAAQGTAWWQQNSSKLRTRIIDRAKYDEFRAAGVDAEQLAKTDYGLYLKKQINTVKAQAQQIAGVALTDEQAQSVASKIYDGFLDDDPLAINALIVPFIGKTTSIVGTGLGAQKITGFSGQALQNYQTLQGIAKANGFTLKDILPGVSALTTGGDLETAVLQKLALGELDVNRIAQDARTLAAQGQPQYVRNLLNQGYDLENIYSPYRQTMASVLEVNPDQINLNDPTLRSAITDKGDMNIYDFKKQLRQDNRWQYTQSAKQEVSDVALRVLQDFGFQG